MAVTAETLEQDLFNDVLAVRTALAKYWTEITGNATQIQTFIQDGITYLENSDKWTGLMTDIGLAGEKLENILDNIPEHELAGYLSEVETELGTEINKVLKDVKNNPVEDLEGAFSGLFNNIGNLDDIPADIQSAIASLKGMVMAILGKQFSVALKPLHPQSSGTGNTGQPTHQQEAEAALNWTEDIETLVENFFADSTLSTDLESLVNTIEGLSTTELSALETQVEASLKSLAKALKKGKPLTLTLIIAQLKSLLETEESTLQNTATALFTALKTALSKIFAQLKYLLTTPLAGKSDLCKLYNELTGLGTTPSLLEVISIIIAIPVTLVANTTGIPFTIPPKAFLPNPSPGGHQSMALATGDNTGDTSFPESGRLIGQGCLGLCNALYLCVDKYATTQMKKDGGAVSSDYKIVKGVIVGLISATSQGMSYPTSKGFFSGPSMSNSFWFGKCITVVGFGITQSVVDAYLTRKLEQYVDTDNDVAHKLKSDITTLQSNYGGFYNAYVKYLNEINNTNNQVAAMMARVGKAYDKIDTRLKTPYGDYRALTAIKKDVDNMSTQSKLSDAIEAISEITITTELIDEVIDSLTAVKSEFNDDTVVKNNIDLYITTFKGYKTVNFASCNKKLGDLPGITDEPSTGYEALKTSNSHTMDRVFPALTIALTAINAVWSIIIYHKQTTKDPVDLVFDIGPPIPTLLSNGATWYFSKHPPEGSSKAKQEKVKKGVDYGTFILSRAFQAALASKQLVQATKVATITKAAYQASGFSLAVTFSEKITPVTPVAKTKDLKSNFVLNPSGPVITDISKSSSGLTYTLTLNEALPPPVTSCQINVKKDTFLGPNGDVVSPTPVNIKKATS